MNLAKREIVTALGAGCVSAAIPLLVIILANKNPIFLSFALLFPLPVYLTYLSQGVKAGAMASLIGMIGSVMWGATGLVVLYALTLLSAYYFCKKALLSRESDGNIEYYPESLLTQSLSIITIILCLVISFIIALIDANEMAILLEHVNKNMPSLSREQSAQISALFKFIPAILSLYWAGMQLLNGLIAQKILEKKQKALRPSFSLENNAVKDIWLYGLAIGGIAIFVLDGTLEILALNLVFVLMLPYWLMGMGTIHAFFNSKGKPLRNMVWGIYLLIFLIPILYLIIVALGIFEPWIQLKSRIRYN